MCLFFSPYADFQILRLTENTRLSSLRNAPHASETGLLFLSYLLWLGEGRLEESEGSMVELPESVHKVLRVYGLCTSASTPILCTKPPS